MSDQKQSSGEAGRGFGAAHLLACPFCGEPIILIGQGSDDKWNVCCTECNANIARADSFESAALMWNRRQANVPDQRLRP